MKKIKYLILDAGGVMLHPLFGDWNIPARYREFLKDQAESVFTPEFQRACEKYSEILREDIFVDGLEAEYAARRDFLSAIARELQWPLNANEIAAFAEDFTYNGARYHWYSDSMPFLQAWSGRIALGVLSDAMPSFGSLIRKSPAAQLFSGIVISTEVGAAKPDPRMYRAIIDQMGALNTQSLFVDDKLINLRGAAACGMQAVQMDREGNLPKGEFDQVHNFSELSAYLEARL